MNPFLLNHLSDVEFEEFCYDLLGELGFVNLNWRKGTGLSSSPADRGRDIECQWERVDIDGSRQLEKWFVECKHYEHGVPPERLQGALSWSTAENPNALLIITSNFLSNPAKDYLKDYERTNNPRFNIKVWERPDLEKLTLNKIRLLRKYQIAGEFPFLSILHPAHILYIRKSPFNTLDYLFQLLDKLESAKRDNILSWAYEAIIRPRRNSIVTEILGMKIEVPDQAIDEVSYEAFKEKCYQIARTDIIDQILLVFLIVNFVLQRSFAISDTTSIDERLREHEETDKYLRERAEMNPDEKGDIERIIETARNELKDLPQRVERNYKDYVYFCENVISQLFLEEFDFIRSRTQSAS